MEIWMINYIKIRTHIGFVLESVFATRSATVKMSSALTTKGTMRSWATFGSSKPLKSFLKNSWIFSVIIGVHLYVRCRYINLKSIVNEYRNNPPNLDFFFDKNKYLITTILDTMIVSLATIVRTSSSSFAAIVQRRIPHETMCEGIVPLFVPLFEK